MLSAHIGPGHARRRLGADAHVRVAATGRPSGGRLRIPRDGQRRQPRVPPRPRPVVRTVITAVAVLIALYLVYLLRKPIGWLLIALFLAVALSGPVNLLERFMKRGAGHHRSSTSALFLVPVGIGAIVVPADRQRRRGPGQGRAEVRQGRDEYVNDNERLQRAQRELRPHREAERGGRAAAVEGRRRRRAAARRRLRPGQLDLRAGHDPDPHRVHARRRPRMDQRRPALLTPRTGARA